MSQVSLDELVDLALRPPFTLKVGPNGKSIVLNDKSLTARTLNIQALGDLIPEMQDWPLAKLRALEPYLEALYMKLFEKARELRGQADAASIAELYYDSEGRFPALDTLVLVDPNDMRWCTLLNELTQEHERYRYSFIEKHIKFPKGYGPTVVPVREVYCPELPPRSIAAGAQIQALYPDCRSGVWNHYQPPQNALAPLCSDAALHPAMERFFNHLFANEASRDYVYRWLYSLCFLHGKPTPALILCGKAAIGKNTLVENIMVGLVGLRNFHKSAQLSERFNSSVLNCTLHFSDEGEVGGLIKRNLKGFHELYVAIERKGVDVAAPEKIYARFVVATNNRRDLKMDYNDRKFSVPELTETKLTHALSSEECAYLFAFKDNVEAQIQFRSWLANNHAHDNAQEYYHGALFKQLCYESLPAWFRSFLKMLESEREFSLRDFKKRCDNRTISVDTVLHQVEAYHHEMGYTMVEHYVEEGMDYFRSLIYKGDVDD